MNKLKAAGIGLLTTAMTTFGGLDVVAQSSNLKKQFKKEAKAKKEQEKLEKNLRNQGYTFLNGDFSAEKINELIIFCENNENETENEDEKAEWCYIKAAFKCINENQIKTVKDAEELFQSGDVKLEDLSDETVKRVELVVPTEKEKNSAQKTTNEANESIVTDSTDYSDYEDADLELSQRARNHFENLGLKNNLLFLVEAQVRYETLIKNKNKLINYLSKNIKNFDKNSSYIFKRFEFEDSRGFPSFKVECLAKKSPSETEWEILIPQKVEDVHQEYMRKNSTVPNFGITDKSTGTVVPFHFEFDNDAGTPERYIRELVNLNFSLKRSLQTDEWNFPLSKRDCNAMLKLTREDIADAYVRLKLRSAQLSEYLINM